MQLMGEKTEAWERKTLKQLVLFAAKEQRSTRRWNVFFKFFLLLYVLGFSALFVLERPGLLHQLKQESFTAVVELDGAIMGNKPANAKNVIRALNSAFKNPLTGGVVLKINSPGGSPVQSRQIYDEMNRLKTVYPNKKLIAVIEDTGASGAYLIATAADEIYADETSLIGSIGVIVNSFGFVGTMERLGVERRLYTAGENKALIDPFSPRNAEQEELLKEHLMIIHQAFINNVKEGRGDRLQETDDMFSGRIWSGFEAKKLGLIDGFGDSGFVAREIFKIPGMVSYSMQRPFFSQLGGRFSEALNGWISELMAPEYR